MMMREERGERKDDNNDMRGERKEQQHGRGERKDIDDGEEGRDEIQQRDRGERKENYKIEERGNTMMSVAAQAS